MSSRFSGGLPSTNGRSNSKAAPMPQPNVIMLENLPKKDTAITQTTSRDGIVRSHNSVILKGVPIFLIDAFDRILEEGKTTEGLFRKEGNAARMKNSQEVFENKESVTAPGNNWTVHDVCSLVKRFLRDLKTPLITPEIKSRLFEYARKHVDGVIDSHKLKILFGPSFSDKGRVHPMSSENIGTLGFIMRKLLELSEDSSVHQMNIQNLATVFAPTIFRDQSIIMEPPKTPKMAHGKTSLALQKSMEENELRIAAMLILIKNAEWIGVASEIIASSSCTSAAAIGGSSSFSGAPSSSIGPSLSHKNSLQPTNSLDGDATMTTINYNKADKGRTASGRKIEKRHSVKTTIASRMKQEEKEAKERRRSNSTVRDFITNKIAEIGDRVRRRSKDPERKAPIRDPSPPLSASRRGKGGGGEEEGSRGRSTVKKTMLEVDEHAMRALATPNPSSEASPIRKAVATGRPSLNSSSFLQALPVKSSPDLLRRYGQQQQTTVTTQQKQRPTRPPPPAPDCERASKSKIGRVSSKEKKKGSASENRRIVSGGNAAVSTTQPLPRKVTTSVHQESNWIVNEEIINPNHKFPVNRARRHTTPIKGGGLALRRNQPNTIHSGLRGPMRRATMAAADDKENAREMFRVIGRREKRLEEEELWDEEDNTLTDTNRTMTSGIAAVYTSETIIELNHDESRLRRANNWKRRRSGGIGEKENETSTTQEHSNIENTNDAAKSSKSPAPPPLPLCSPPTSIVERVGSGHGSSKRSVGGDEEERRGGDEMEDVEMRVPPLSAPPIPCPRSSFGGTNSPHFAIPSLPVGRPTTVFSYASSFATPSMPRRPIGTTLQGPLATKTAMAATNSPLGRKGSSVSALDSPQFKAPPSFVSRRQMSVGEKEFASSESNRAAILKANDPTDLQTRTQIGTRPSVALITKGLVKNQVIHFNTKSQSKTDAVNASMRSSAGSRQSLTGLDETIQSGNVVRGGPPVGHSIVSSGGSSSGNNTKRSSVASHR